MLPGKAQGSWALKVGQRLVGLPSPCPIHFCPTQSLAIPVWVPGFGAEGGRQASSAQPGIPLPAGSLPSSIHAEFQLSEPPDFPFWFSPGQFTGHIILSKDATHVRDFRLFVPNHR